MSSVFINSIALSFLACLSMSIRGVSTIKDHWMFGQGVRRGLMFGVLSRCFYRVALTVDNSRQDKYGLTRWVIEQPERFRNLTWRSFSSEAHLVRGIIIEKAKDGDIIYVDPPYDYEDDDGFTKYQMNGFSFDDFKVLKGVCDCAIDKGATVIISNNSTEKVIELFNNDIVFNTKSA